MTEINRKDKLFLREKVQNKKIKSPEKSFLASRRFFIALSEEILSAESSLSARSNRKPASSPFITHSPRPLFSMLEDKDQDKNQIC